MRQKLFKATGQRQDPIVGRLFDVSVIDIPGQVRKKHTWTNNSDDGRKIEVKVENSRIQR